MLCNAAAGESYLNFMGNEFGHPEWIDFPRDDTYDPSTGAFVPGEYLICKIMCIHCYVRCSSVTYTTQARAPSCRVSFMHACVVW